MKWWIFLKGLILVIFFVGSIDAMAITLKIATISPEGTAWTNNLDAIRAEIQQKTKGRVKFTGYYGGVMGDESDVLRKIRIGQLHGGIFTGRTLGKVFSDTRVMEVPFNFQGGHKQAMKVLKELTPYFAKGFEKKGFKSLGFFGVGDIYLVFTRKFTNLQQLRGVKVWSWEGDHLASLFAKEIRSVAVPLALPEVLGALSTGIVHAAYASPAAMLALQWSSKIKYFMDHSITYSIAGFFLSSRAWEKISAQDRMIIEQSINGKLQKIIDETKRENDQAIEALRTVGVEFIKFPQSDILELNKTADTLFEKLKEQKILSDTVIKRFKQVVGK